ncbi:response regulator transcription factor [Methylomonas sp. AM2-LC]|uniref:response regulator n=1 Tax=Methylomonas sp. AM2-LC TaxID=3153301 RepID=UPI0032666FA5
MIKVLMADDNDILREGLKQLFLWAGDIFVSGIAINGAQVLEQLGLGGFDILLLDMAMPEPNGVDLIARIRAIGIKLPILVLSMHNDPQIVRLTLQAGASGYLTKDTEPEKLLKVIREIAAGGEYIPSFLLSNGLKTDTSHFVHI